MCRPGGIDCEPCEGLGHFGHQVSDAAGQTGRTVQVDGTGYLMSEVAQALARLAVNPPDLHMEAQSLEEVFLEESLESAPSQSRQSVTDRPGPEGVDQ